jgi:nucleoside-diphosphate-sugar epimerase
MTILVVGASGATGQLLLSQLLERGEHVKAIVRPNAALPEAIKTHNNLQLIVANISEMGLPELREHVLNCHAVLSCLGHALSFKGIYGQPRRLVTDTVRHLCQAIEANKPAVPIKLVLMNTTGNRNKDCVVPISFAQHLVIGLLRLLLPPHVDNEQAADFLRSQIGQHHHSIEWAAVRPDGLVDHDEVTQYQLHPSPTRSAIFDAGQTSRINVGHFMAELVTNDALWQKWKGKMPVIYNAPNNDI